MNSTTVDAGAMKVDPADVVFLGGARCRECGAVSDYVAHMDSF